MTRFSHNVPIMLHRCLPSLLLCVAAVGAKAPAVGTVVDKQGAGVIERGIVVAPAQFTKLHVEQFSRDFIESNKGKFKILKLVIGLDERDVVHQMSGKGMFHVFHGQSYISKYQAQLRMQAPVAETIVINGSAVMRWRDGQGRIERVVLGGTDPLLVRLSGSPFEILHITATKVPERYREPPEETFEIHYYVRASAPMKISTARDFTIDLIRRVGLKQIGVQFRYDKWFMDDPYFPTIYRFEPLGPVPTDQEYLKGPSVACTNSSKRGVRCGGNVPP